MLSRRSCLSLFFAKVLRRGGLVQWLDLVLPVDSLGGRFRIPLQRGGITEHLLKVPDGGFKADLVKLLAARHLFPGLVCDVGINVGQTLLEIYGQNLPISDYYGFEPNSSAMAIVERLVALNPRLKSVTLFPWACSSQDQPLRFFVTSETDSGATIDPSIRPDWYVDMQGSFAASYRLDLVAKFMKLCRYFFLKIDVEGGELEVLRGAE